MFTNQIDHRHGDIEQPFCQPGQTIAGWMEIGLNQTRIAQGSETFCFVLR
jgi:hypothetical protein